MPRGYPFDAIPDRFGGSWKIITWECHKCKNKNWISDGNMRWNFKTPEKCRTKDCYHLRCIDCYDCDEDEIRLQRCDGAIDIISPSESEAIKRRDWNPLPGDKRPTSFPCPFKAKAGCNMAFLTSGHAAHHAAVHEPVAPIPCSFPGCGRQFALVDDESTHFLMHTAPTPLSCPFRDCDMIFKTEEAKDVHLKFHFSAKRGSLHG